MVTTHRVYGAEPLAEIDARLPTAKWLAAAGGTEHAERMDHLAAPALEAGLDDIRLAPADLGRVELIVRRPAEDEREILDEATLDSVHGLVGDSWLARGSSRTSDGRPPVDTQITIMNARVASLVAVGADRRCLAGDQLYLDLDISHRNVPPGSRLELGTAVIEVTGKPHTGCHKFAARFGQDAVRFVNSPEGRELRLRGANARVIVPGVVHVGDLVRKLLRPQAAVVPGEVTRRPAE
jgi:hypothetical protein